MELGARLKELREARQLSREAAALELGVSRQAVTKWESGQSNPSTASLMALCKLYNVSRQSLPMPAGFYFLCGATFVLAILCIRRLAERRKSKK